MKYSSLIIANVFIATKLWVGFYSWIIFATCILVVSIMTPSSEKEKRE